MLQLLDSDATRLSFEAGPEDKKSAIFFDLPKFRELT
jgi:hypothetical protein